MGHKRKLFFTLFILTASLLGFLPTQATAEQWRAATPAELQTVIPARAPVGNERIETEMRTASGVTDASGKFIAGVVLITAGYSANGKYSHFFLTQVPVEVGSFSLRPGQYVIGWHRQDDELAVGFYEASSGKLLGTVAANRTATSRVESFRITPPGEKPQIFIGRFAFDYRVASK